MTPQRCLFFTQQNVCDEGGKELESAISLKKQVSTGKGNYVPLF
jgi:hypothetical protein